MSVPSEKTRELQKLEQKIRDLRTEAERMERNARESRKLAKQSEQMAALARAEIERLKLSHEAMRVHVQDKN